MTQDPEIEEEITRRSQEGEAYAVATIVRTVASTSARPGNKALLDAEGKLITGFLGGGCVRGAVGRAARDAIREGAPQFVSLKPQDLLDAEGVQSGDEIDGVRYARNGCPSRGSMDVFVEPVLPKPALVICGTSKVARALAEMSGRFGFNRTLCLSPADDGSMPVVEDVIELGENAPVWARNPYVVVATQGQGDAIALKQALAGPTRHIAFVGSRAKFAALRDKLLQDNVTEDALNRVEAPAGVHIHAITPDEIALSILARLVQVHRLNTRTAETDDV